MSDIQEMNKVIAIFDDYQFGDLNSWMSGVRKDMFYQKDAKGDIVKAHKIDGLKYHTSWDWLMPVVQKILKTDTGTMDMYSLWLEDSLRTADINKVHKNTFDFIQWYNTQRE